MNDSVLRFSFDDIANPENHAQFLREAELLQRYNDPALGWDERRALLPQLVASCGEETNVAAPFHLARGCDVHLGRRVFINAGVTIAAAAPVTIGDYTLIAPHVQIHAVTHPVDPAERQRWAFWSKPITIGENVWIGAGAIICAGVTIGDHSVIGAGSVVTRDVPSCVLAAGNPCRVVRALDPPDPATLYALRE